MNKILLVVGAIVLTFILYAADLSTSNEVSDKLVNAPHYTSEVIIEPNTELAETFKCTVKLTNLETGENISGPNLVLVKGMDGNGGTSHDWLNLDTYIKASIDKEGKSVNYSFDIYYKDTKISNNTGMITLE